MFSDVDNPDVQEASQRGSVTYIIGVADSPNITPTLPLFVTELQDPLNILLGYKVVIFQCLKENRTHFFQVRPL